MALASAIQNGTLSNYDTGNAQYFQSNQGQASTVVGGNSANIGGNYFLIGSAIDQFRCAVLRRINRKWRYHDRRRA
jgi:hypothetical protein